MSSDYYVHGLYTVLLIVRLVVARKGRQFLDKTSTVRRMKCTLLHQNLGYCSRILLHVWGRLQKRSACWNHTTRQLVPKQVETVTNS